MKVGVSLTLYPKVFISLVSVIFLCSEKKKRFSVVATGRRDRTFITFDKCFVFVDSIIFKHVPLESKMFVFVDVGRGSQNWQFFAKILNVWSHKF